MTKLIAKLQKYRAWFARGTLILVLIVGVLFIVDYLFSPYKQCMRAEKLEAAFLGVGDDAELRAKTCARRVRKSQW